MSRSTAKLLSVILAIVVVIICCGFIFSDHQAAVIFTFIIYLPVALYLNYCQRCKSCGRWPRKGDFWDEYCPRCGAPLDD